MAESRHKHTHGVGGMLFKVLLPSPFPHFLFLDAENVPVMADTVVVIVTPRLARILFDMSPTSPFCSPNAKANYSCLLLSYRCYLFSYSKRKMQYLLYPCLNSFSYTQSA